jgi:NTE family protein
MPRSSLRDWLEEAPFTLALSSSFFGFFAHGGVAEGLRKAGFRPRRITGSSAGALVGGAIASGLEPSETRDLLFGVKKRDFWDPAPGLGLLRGRKFLRIVEKNFVPTFSEAKLPFEAAVFDVLGCRTRFLSEGSLPRAVVASCAVPLLFHPVRIGARVFVDGGVFHKSGIRLEHPADRTLCIFLQGDGLADSYEWGRSFSRLGRNQRVLRFRNLPRVNYDSLEDGPAAYREGKRRLLRALDLPSRGPILEA